MGVRNLHSPRLLCRAKTAGALHQAAAGLRLLVQKHQLTFAPKHCPVARCSHSHGALVGTAAFTLRYCALLCLPPPTKLLWASGNQDNFTYSDKWHSSVCFLTENTTFRRQWESRELHWLAVSGIFNIFLYTTICILIRQPELKGEGEIYKIKVYWAMVSRTQYLVYPRGVREHITPHNSHTVHS